MLNFDVSPQPKMDMYSGKIEVRIGNTLLLKKRLRQYRFFNSKYLLRS